MEYDNWDKNKYSHYEEKLQKIFHLHKEVKDIHFSLEKLYPIAIVEDNKFLVFDIDENKERYVFIKSHPTPMAIPKGIKAAFNLDFYDNKLAAVVSPEIFDSLEGYIFIFHEFVHCHQFYNCSLNIKNNLKVYQKSMKNEDYMWEINYPFPYDDLVYVEKTLKLENYFNNLDKNRVNKYYIDMKNYLDEVDYEYMIWQQWKEGFARYIENKIRDILGEKKNSSEIKVPFDRVSFYEIGSRYISLLLKVNPELNKSIEDLFYTMFDANF